MPACKRWSASLPCDIPASKKAAEAPIGDE